mmetsp:Transcript_19842/g.43068  ORF Transcript_19842/g.43068 Transcript_19842/m.43068 type:complete len:211 (+) Transcript_19842:288-920(+)
MNIILNSQRESVVHHQSDVWDVQSSRSDIRGNHNLTCTLLKVRQGLSSGSLVFVSMDGTHVKAITLKIIFHAFCLFLVKGKNKNSALALVLSQNIPQTIFSRTIFDNLDGLCDPFVGRERVVDAVFSVASYNAFKTNIKPNRIIHVIHCNILDDCWPCRRKHRCLPSIFFRHTIGYDVFDILFKSHIKHSICLIEDQMKNFAKITCSLVD